MNKEIKKTGGRLRIAHISDLHICSKYKKQNLRKTAFLLEKALDQGSDHVVITGDLVDNPNARDFEAARRLFEDFGLLHPDKLTLTIGNHEIFGGVHLASDIFDFPKRCLQTDYRKREIEFRRYFFEAFEDTVTTEDGDIFPFAKQVGGLVFFGINSIAPYSRIRNLFASQGTISHSDMEKLKMLFSIEAFRDKRKIFLMHHHPCSKPISATMDHPTLWNKVELRTLRFRKTAKLANLLSSAGVDLVLHGHVHESVEYQHRGLRFLNGAGALNSAFSDSMAINFIDVQTDSINTQILNYETVRMPAQKSPRSRHAFFPLFEEEYSL